MKYKKTRNRITAIFATWMVGLVFSGGVMAQSAYPNKPIKMIIPFAPGGASDFVGRILAVKMGEILGQQIVVDNRSGAAGNIGMDVAAKSSPDGYTIFLGNIGTVAINPALFPTLNINPLRDFEVVTEVADVPSALIGNLDFPPSNVQELVAYLKENPGKFNFATPGGGSANRLEMEIFMKTVGAKMVHVPYKGGGGPAAIGVIGGETQLMFNTLPSVKQFMIANKVKSYAVTSASRQPGLPNVPTMLELGYPDLVTGSWQCILVPTGTPSAVVKTLFAAITKALDTPEMKERISNGGANIVLSKSPEAAKVFVSTEIQRWGKVIKESGTTPD